MTSLHPDIAGRVGSDGSDGELVRAHLGGDPDAFGFIVRRYSPVLLGVARRRLGSVSDSEDAVQDCFERAYKHLHAVRDTGTDCTLGPWLLRILANVCTDMISRWGRQRALPEKIAALQSEPMWTEFELRDPADSRNIGEAIAGLPSNQREAFLLREWNGFEYPTVAQMIGVSEDNARARVHRARRALQRRLTALHGNVLAGVALVAGWRRGLFGLPRRTSDAVTQMLLVQSPEGTAVSTGSTVAAVVTVAAGLVTVGTGAGLITASGSQPSAAVHVAAAPLNDGPSGGANSKPQLKGSPPGDGSSGGAPTTGGSVPAGTQLGVPLVVPSGSRTTQAAGGAGDVSTPATTIVVTTPTTLAVPAAPPVDLSWVPAAEVSEAPAGNAGSASSPSAASSAQPDSGCQALSSMPGPGIPSSTAGSLAGLNVSSLLTSTQSATTSGGFALFEGPADLTVPGATGVAPVVLQDTAAVCLSGPTQVIVADLSVPGDPQAGELQLRGALVATTASSTTSGAYFRGSAIDLSSTVGSPLDTLPTGFVGEVSCANSSHSCGLTIAFVANPAASRTTGGAQPATPGPSGNSTTTTTPDPYAGTYGNPVYGANGPSPSQGTGVSGGGGAASRPRK